MKQTEVAPHPPKHFPLWRSHWRRVPPPNAPEIRATLRTKNYRLLLVSALQRAPGAPPYISLATPSNPPNPAIDNDCYSIVTNLGAYLTACSTNVNMKLRFNQEAFYRTNKKGKTMDTDTTSEATVENSTPTFRELQDQLAQVTRDKQALEERNEYNTQRRNAQEARVDHQRYLESYRNAHIERSLNSALNHYAHDLPQLDESHPDVAKLIQGVVQVARVVGFLSDVSTAIGNLPESITNWSEIQNDESLLLNTEADKDMKVREIVRDTLRTLELHPRDPRFHEFWKQVTINATQEHLCPEFDKLANMFGIPTDMELEYEGYVNLEGVFHARQFVTGTATRAEILDGDITDEVDLNNADTEIEESSTDLTFS